MQSLSATERERERALTQVKSQRSEQLEAAEALEAETRRIQSLLANLERRRTEREELARREAEEAGREAPAPAASTSACPSATAPTRSNSSSRRLCNPWENIV